MINYFNYDYPEATGDDPFITYSEVAACPWASEHKLLHIGLQGKKIKTDDLPASNLEVTRHAFELLGKTPPAPVPFEEAAKSMSPMALSFYADSRRVSNTRMKEELGYELIYPDDRAGLKAQLSS